MGDIETAREEVIAAAKACRVARRAPQMQAANDALVDATANLVALELDKGQ